MRNLVIFAVLATLAAPVAARPQDGDDKKLSDPNRMVCRASEIIGSRLGTKKTCMTAMQWDQKQREERSTVERIQSLRTTNGT